MCIFIRIRFNLKRRIYVQNEQILNTSEVDLVDFTQVLETSKESSRYTTDGSKFLLKYDGNQPSFLSGKTEYT